MNESLLMCIWAEMKCRGERRRRKNDKRTDDKAKTPKTKTRNIMILYVCSRCLWNLLLVLLLFSISLVYFTLHLFSLPKPLFCGNCKRNYYSLFMHSFSKNFHGSLTQTSLQFLQNGQFENVWNKSATVRKGLNVLN